MIPTLWAFVFGLAAWYARRDSNILIVLCVALLFGATAAFQVVFLSGAPVTPVLMILGLAALMAVQRHGLAPLLNVMALPGPGGVLLLFVLWALFAAIVLPRVFAGDMLVYTTSRGEEASLLVQLVPLGPNSTNLTQSAYLIANLIAFVVLSFWLRAKGGLEAFFKGMCWVAGLNLLAAVVNMAEALAGVNLGLSLVRNANYAQITGDAIGRLVRIHGTFSEASSFAAFTAPLFAFFGVCWLLRFRTLVSVPLCLGSGVALFLSTSTTAYVTLIVFFAAAMVWVISHALASMRSLRLGAISALLLIASASICVVALFKPEWLMSVWHYFEAIVVRKLSSDSGIERSEWNRQAFQSFIDSYGIGIGTGSARGSGWPVVVLSNLGVIGFALLLVFFAKVLMPVPGRKPLEGSLEAACAAAGTAALGVFVTGAALSGTVVDPGMLPFIMAACIYAARQRSIPVESWMVGRHWYVVRPKRLAIADPTIPPGALP